MATSEVYYLGNLRTKAIHLKSGNEIITDAPTDNNGKGEYFSPTDLVATAYASCILTIIGISANNFNLNIDSTKVQVTKIMNDNPRKIKEIQLIFNFPNITYTSKQKKAIINIIKTCPVGLSLNPDIKRNITLIFNDEQTNFIL
jgi:uncharacterized OsmC-like protein